MKSVIILEMLLLLTDSAWTGTFIETFNDAGLEEWQELNVHDAIPGTWEILDGELEGINLGGAARFLITGGETWQNYTIAFDVKPLKKHGPGIIGIAARIKGTQVFWCRITDLMLNDPESKVVCSSRDVHKNRGPLLHLSRHPLLKLNKWSRLELSVNEDYFIFSINKKKIVETGDPFILMQDGREIELKTRDLSHHPIPAGGAGFALSNYTARFDNITITGADIPDTGRLVVSPERKLAITWGKLKRF